MKTTTIFTALGVALSMTGVSTAAAERHATATAAPAKGTITTFAGGGVGDGLQATRAFLINPVALATDGAGTLYIADAGELRVRAVRNGIMTTLAGTGDQGTATDGDNGPATAARLHGLAGIAADRAGDVFISDGAEPGAVRRIDTHGVITTLASHLWAPMGLVASADGSVVYTAEKSGSRVIAIPTTGGSPTTVAGFGPPGPPATGAINDEMGDSQPANQTHLNSPEDVALDSTGQNLFIADTSDSVVRKVNLPANTITTVLGATSTTGTSYGSDVLRWPASVAVDSHGRTYVSDYDDHISNTLPSRILVITSPGSPGADRVLRQDPTSYAASHYGVSHFVATGPHDDVYVTMPACDTGTGVATGACVIELRTGTLVAGGPKPDDPNVEGQAATSAFLAGLTGVVSDAAGQVYFTDATQVIRVDASGAAWTVAGNGSGPDPSDKVVRNDEGQRARNVILKPEAVASDGRGNVYVSDQVSHRVLRVDSQGVLHDVAGDGYGGAVDQGDGRPAVSVSVSAVALLVTRDGTLDIADQATDTVRNVDRQGVITTVAGLPHNTQTAVDTSSCVGTTSGSGSYVRNGGPATQACLNGISSLAMDGAGNLYIAEAAGDIVDKVTPSGAITVVAGASVSASDVGGVLGALPLGCPDGGPATAPCLGTPQGIAVDAAGNLFIADTRRMVVRKVDPSGTITTVVGGPTSAVRAISNVNDVMSYVEGAAQRGDGGPATSASLKQPVAVAVDAVGDLLVADAGDGRIREVGGVAAAHAARASMVSWGHRPRLNHTL